MAKYHINAKGESGICRATRECPFGGENEHYDTAADARRAYEKFMTTGKSEIQIDKFRELDPWETTLAIEEIVMCPRKESTELRDSLANKNKSKWLRKNNKLYLQVDGNKSLNLLEVSRGYPITVNILSQYNYARQELTLEPDLVNDAVGLFESEWIRSHSILSWNDLEKSWQQKLEQTMGKMPIVPDQHKVTRLRIRNLENDDPIRVINLPKEVTK
jgi:hypothetical protein